MHVGAQKAAQTFLNEVSQVNKHLYIFDKILIENLNETILIAVKYVTVKYIFYRNKIQFEILCVFAKGKIRFQFKWCLFSNY